MLLWRSQTSFCPPDNVHLQPLPVSPQLPPPFRVTERCCYTVSWRCLVFSCSGVRGWFTHLRSRHFLHPACSALTRPFSTICPCSDLLEALVFVYHLSIQQLVISSLRRHPPLCASPVFCVLLVVCCLICV